MGSKKWRRKEVGHGRNELLIVEHKMEKKILGEVGQKSRKLLFYL